MKPTAAVVFALSSVLQVAKASGPVAPPGWNGAVAPELPSGQECCLPADLNGAKLVGGAFVLVSDDKKRFAVFALTYAAAKGKPNESWSMLESHAVDDLPRFKISITPTSQVEKSAVRVCEAAKNCRHYSWNSLNNKFVKATIPAQ